jgi:hypothetical protein
VKQEDRMWCAGCIEHAEGTGSVDGVHEMAVDISYKETEYAQFCYK